MKSSEYRKVNQTAVEQDCPARSGVPMKASLGGAETKFPEYQDSLTKLPPNPPIKQVEQQEQQQDAAAANFLGYASCSTSIKNGPKASATARLGFA